MRSHARGVPTRYRGVNFRSRLEARYASFFDQLSLSWVYEPPTDDLCRGWLPDFEVLGVLVECKPSLTWEGLQPAMRKAEASGYTGQVTVLGGRPDLAYTSHLPQAEWRLARWRADPRLPWALAGNAVQWRPVRPGNAGPAPGVS